MTQNTQPNDDVPVMVITGSSKGIGRGMAEYFASHGYRVVGCSRGPAEFEVPGYFHHQVDLTDERQVQGWARKVRQEFGKVDVLVCNAGLVKSALLMAVTPGSLVDAFLRTNIAGTFFVCREFSKMMLARRAGRIITISSIMTEIHDPGTSLYSATKSAINEMTKVMAKELAPSGITCNVVSPAMALTESSHALGEEWATRMLDKQTLKRPVTIEELCNVVSFFAKPESACITGQIINMCLVN